MMSQDDNAKHQACNLLGQPSMLTNDSIGHPSYSS